MPSVVAKSGEASIRRRTHILHEWKFADTLAKQRFQMAKRRCASAAPSCQNAFSRCRSHFRLTDLDPLLPTFSLRLGGGGGGGSRATCAQCQIRAWCGRSMKNPQYSSEASLVLFQVGSILANFWKVEVGTLEMGCDLDHSDRKAIIARAKPSLF